MYMYNFIYLLYELYFWIFVSEFCLIFFVETIEKNPDQIPEKKLTRFVNVKLLTFKCSDMLNLNVFAYQCMYYNNINKQYCIYNICM